MHRQVLKRSKSGFSKLQQQYLVKSAHSPSEGLILWLRQRLASKLPQKWCYRGQTRYSHRLGLGSRSQGEGGVSSTAILQWWAEVQREQRFGQCPAHWGLKPHLVSFAFIRDPVSFLPTQCRLRASCQQQQLLYQKWVLTQKCILEFFFTFLHTPLVEDNLPFLPLQGASCSSGTAAHPLPVNVSLCFLPGRHWSCNQGKLLHNSGQQAFCFTLTLACDWREFGCRALDNKGLSPVHGPVSPSWTSGISC